MKTKEICGLTCWVMDDGRLLLKDVLDEERIKKYCNDDKYRDGNGVRHSFNLYPPFKWEDSYIKNVILPAFKKDLGIDCEVDLLTKEEAEALPNEVRCCNSWYWTKSDATENDDKIAYAWGVASGGGVNRWSLHTTASVRPVLTLKSNIDENAKDNVCNHKFEVDEKGRIKIQNHIWQGRKLDVEIVKAINYLIEKIDKDDKN